MSGAIKNEMLEALREASMFIARYTAGSGTDRLRDKIESLISKTGSHEPVPVARQDHAKYCEMRHHSCTCGYEAQLEASVAAITASPVAWRYRPTSAAVWDYAEGTAPRFSQVDEWLVEPLYSASTVEALTAERDAALSRAEKAEAAYSVAQRNMRDNFDALCTMRNSINEHIPMPSLESDLLQGPEASVFCSVVAEAVIAALEGKTNDRI